jgi:PKD repeat protein
MVVLCLGWGLHAQASVEGTVYFGATINAPVPNWPVTLYLDEDLVVAEGETDESGRYYLATDATIAGGPVWWVETPDLCTGELTRAAFEVEPGTTHYEQDIYICADINPPPPPDTCQAYFSWEQLFLTEAPLMVAFYDLSFGPLPTDTEPQEWQWDFGDGTTSNEASPTHLYAEAGAYSVTLTYRNGDCTSTTVQDVLVTDLSTCDCPTDEVIPVCVYLPSGQIITFDNGCWAGCAGFEEGEWFVCEEDCFCPEIYDPVCVLTASGDTLSFTNACFAECEGFGPDEYFACTPNPGCDCPEIYDPVCVATPGLGLILTFDNACFAECAGYGPDIYYPCDGDCVCPEFYSPVCVLGENGDILTFDNYCFAECAGYGPDQWLDCESDDCDCPEDLYDPVCVISAAGIIVFHNACEAECAGFEPGMYQPCDGDCECPEIYEPVCVVDPLAGDVLTFDNYCLAQCAGYGPDQWTDCDPDPCDCPADVYDPVCVYTASGVIITFPNPCFAECEGFNPDQWEPCDGYCECPEYYDPVCVTLDSGEIIEFSNECFARCEGYGPEDWESCNGEGCDCPEDLYDPVCVLGPAGVIRFINPCEAACAGYGSEDYVNCETSDCDHILVATQIDEYVYQFEIQTDDITTIESVTWNFGDGTTSTELSPTHTFPPTPGFYIVTAEVVNSAGCQTVLTELVITAPECYAIIIALPADENPLGIAFGAIATGNVVAWNWDFGDGNTSTEGAPVHVYAEPGTYTVTLTIATETGCNYTTIQAVAVDEEDCPCPDVWDPVCVVGVAGYITFGNACEAECAGFTEEDFVDCPDDCQCPTIWDPVCVAGTAGIITFPNACEAICAGFTEADFLDECFDDCECEDIYDPVCVIVGDAFLFFSNACEAGCAGFTDDQIGPCNPGCDCPDIWDPVCVIDANGNETMFGNACEAECAGYGPEQFVECNDCNCDDYYLPVCVMTAAGELLEFPNPCTALCAGYGPDEIIDCSGEDRCRADFTFDFLSEDGLTVQFHDLSYLEGGTSSWFWDFGDGNTSTEPAPVHTYAESGLYDVVLIVSNEVCGEVYVSSHICVGEGGGVPGPECQAFFFLEQPDPDNLLTFQFLNLSFGESAAYIWDFGDGNTSTEVNPLHTYTEAGTYTVSLTVLGEDCENTVAISVTAGENIWYGDLDCRAWFLPVLQV